MTVILVWLLIGVCVFRTWARINPHIRETVTEANELQRVRRQEGFYGAYLKRVVNREVIILIFAAVWPLIVLFILSDLGKQQNS